MALNFESQSVNINKIISTSINTGSSLSLGELQALMAGGVLQELDAQIDMYKSKIEASNEKKSSLRNDINDLNALIGTETTTPATFTNEADKSKVTDTIIKLSDEASFIKIKDACNSYGIWENVSKMAGTYTKDKKTKYCITKEGLEALQTAMDNELTDLNANTETDAIKFQAIMDARKQNLMMLSNMISSDNQTKMSIINNMKS